MISVYQMGEVLGELIETLWNVNDVRLLKLLILAVELIETLWNVN